MSDKSKKRIIIIFLLFSFGATLFYSNRLEAEIMASGTNIQLENWHMADGGPLMAGATFYNVHRASFGLPLVGPILSNPIIINEIPTFENKLLTGFLFVNFFEFLGEDDQFDIVDLKAYEFNGGPELTETTWTNDPDPYFDWNIKVPTLPVEGFSVEFDALPDKFIDTTDFFYQTPDFYLIEGPHVFYVVAKNLDGAFGGVGAFEIWVDTTEPTLSDILPLDASVINEGQPTIQASLFDELSGIDVASIDFQITTGSGTSQVLGNYDPITGVVSFVPPTPLEDGLVTVSLAVDDLAGNQSVPVFWSFTVDTQSPSGTITINNGAAATDSNVVDLQISAIELETAIDSMMISNDGVFDTETWEPYATTKNNWILTVAAGIKTVFIKFRDVALNESPIYSDSILLTISSANTYIISAPPTITDQTDATFVFTSTEPTAEFSYQIDNGSWSPLDPGTTVTLTGLAVGNHFFQVRSGYDVDNSGVIDPDELDLTPAVVSWTIGTLSPGTLVSERPVKYYKRE